MPRFKQKIAEVGEWLSEGALDIYGKPYAGKDEQCKRLVKQFGGAMLSSGEILRSISLPPDVAQSMGKGDIIPSQYFIEGALHKIGKVAVLGKPLFFSAVGKLPGEELYVIDAAEAAGHPLKAAILLDVTDKEPVRRVTEFKRADDRPDDNPETVAKRCVEFNRTAPVLETFRQRDMLVIVDAMSDERTVYGNMIDGLHNHITTSAAA